VKSDYEYPIQVWNDLINHSKSHKVVVPNIKTSKIIKNLFLFYFFQRPAVKKCENLVYTQAHFNISLRDHNRLLDPYLKEQKIFDKQCRQLTLSSDESIREIKNFKVSVSILHLLKFGLYFPPKFFIECFKVFRIDNLISFRQSMRVVIKVITLDFLSQLIARELLERGTNRVITPIHYNFYGFALLRGAKIANVESVALQHGHNTSNHPVFSRMAGYSCEDLESWLPDLYFCWDQCNVNSLPIKFREKVDVKTFAYFDYWTQFVSLDNQVDVLITGQPSVSIGSTFIRETIIACVAARRRVAFRPHPRQIVCLKDFESCIGKVLAQSPLFSLVNNGPLIKSLWGSRLHVTGFSSSILEASSLGIKSIAFDSRALSLREGLKKKNDLVIETELASFKEALTNELR